MEGRALIDLWVGRSVQQDNEDEGAGQGANGRPSPWTDICVLLLFLGLEGLVRTNQGLVSTNQGRCQVPACSVHTEPPALRYCCYCCHYYEYLLNF